MLTPLEATIILWAMLAGFGFVTGAAAFCVLCIWWVRSFNAVMAKIKNLLAVSGDQ